ncbi:hypothetical protein HN587_05510 [Candidatus Woesearchaeota archaeon]|jgi:uncharacterized protein|nr:hypothetical protein [Candidatus Woesearchaeota archaeon]
MIKIIVDTNFFLIPYQFGVDIFSEFNRIVPGVFELFIIDKTIDELEGIIEGQAGKNREAAKLGLTLVRAKIKSNQVSVLKTEKHLNVDQLILNLLKEGRFAVATQDAGLKRRIKVLNSQLIVLRQMNYLEFI